LNEITIKVIDMKCDGCEATIRKALLKLGGVYDARAFPLPTSHATEPLHTGQTKARCAANGYSIGKRRNAGMARVQGFPSGEPPGGHLLRCALLQGNHPCGKSAPCI